MAAGEEGAVEPWYRIAKGVLLPPNKLWFNWRFEGIERVPREGPLIVVGNHLSYMDQFAHAYFVVQAGRRPRFLAKQELFENWFTRMVLTGAGQIPVQRGTGDVRALDRAREALEGGEVLVVYPEGTTQTSDPAFTPGRGKTGAVRLALMTGARILPVATWGGQYVWRKSGRESLRFGRPIWLEAGELVDLSEHGDELGDRAAVRKLTDDLMATLADLVADLRERYPRRWGEG